MVYKPEESNLRRQDSMKKKKKQQLEGEVRAGKDAKQELVRLPCNKGKACKFKRSCFSEEEDAASSAMLLLACIVCATSSI